MTKSVHMRISADLSNLAVIRRFVEEAALAENGDPEAIADMTLAVNEAATNVILHGYQGRPGIVDVEVVFHEDALVVCLRDQAAPFDPTRDPQAATLLPLQKPRPGGMGIAMMHHLTDELVYRRSTNGGNELTLVKKGVRSAKG
jgi:serine/threonine-protein kinase RsbW